jgi:hypothetical protein
MSERERLFYAENAAGRIYFTSPMSPLSPGYALRSTTNPREMDRIFNRMHAQEREQNEKFLEGLYNRGRERYDQVRRALINRLGLGSVSDAEKNIIRASLKLMDEKDSKMQENNVYGISGMQEAPEPLPPRNQKVSIN